MRATRFLERMIDSLQMTTKNDGDGEAIVGPRPSRRTFCAAAVGAFVPLLAKRRLPSPASEDLHLPEIDVAAIDRTRILRAAKRYLREAPVTITASRLFAVPAASTTMFPRVTTGVMIPLIHLAPTSS